MALRQVSVHPLSVSAHQPFTGMGRVEFCLHTRPSIALDMPIRCSYYSKLNGDDEMTWGPDPLLTALGIQQADAARTAWVGEMLKGVPTPQRSYASPLHRALSTWQITFGSDEIFPENARTVMIFEVRIIMSSLHPC